MKNIKSSTELRTLLRSIDRKGYPAYKALKGAWQFPRFLLVIDHVQGDPFASPSSLHVEIPNVKAGFPAAYFEENCSRIALQDFLTRQFSQQCERYNFKAKGSGKSGLMSITRCGQEVFERSACELKKGVLTVRFKAGFPAFGRTINGEELMRMLFDFLPECVEKSLYFANLNKQKVEQAVFLAQDQEEIRQILKRDNLVAFVANGAVLPRKSGVSSQPMKNSIPFISPPSMERTFVLPHHGEIKGMAIPKGVTLIVGGGYHGKSTLLEAIQAGVYNHIEGDGREYVITEDTAVKLRAEDGRSVRNVDISLFINDLPNKKDTASFTTEDASGSTSQAAAVIEGMEAGSSLFLVDEDTSATNFMVRDAFMQQVISRDKEPITPFIERIRELYGQAGISTIMVAGSSGAFFHIADRVLMMDCYRALDITERVKALCAQEKEARQETFWQNKTLQGKAQEASQEQVLRQNKEGKKELLQNGGKKQKAENQGEELAQSKPKDFFMPNFQRIFPAYGRENRSGRRESGRETGRDFMKIKSYGLDSFQLDKESVNVRFLEQLVDTEQTEALAHLLRYGLTKVIDGKKTVQQAVWEMYEVLERNGFADLCESYVPCGLAKPRIQELYACLNRFRGGM